jgi:hypothetical protein
MDQHRRAKKARLEGLHAFAGGQEQHLKYISSNLSSLSQTTVGFVESVQTNVSLPLHSVVPPLIGLSQTSEAYTSAKTYKTAAEKSLSLLKQSYQNLSEQGNRHDVPTGSTPRKKKWQYNDHWELTEDRERILQRWKSSSVKEEDSDSIEDQLSLKRKGRDPVEEELEMDCSDPPRQMAHFQLPDPLSVAISSYNAADEPVAKSTKADMGPPVLPLEVDTKNIHLARGSRRRR